MRRCLEWLLMVALAVAFVFAPAYSQLHDRTFKGQNDFGAFYAGAKLAGTQDLYSHSANVELVEKLSGHRMEPVVFIRPPFYAALLKPLAAFPYLTAYAIFTLATLSCIVWFVVCFSKECPSLPVLALFSLPLPIALFGGQDTPFLLAILGVAILLMRKKQDLAAGFVLSLLAIKFHLFLLLPVLLVLKKRWRILSGAVSGTLLLTMLGVLVTGLDSFSSWLKVLRDPRIDPNVSVIPNLHGIAQAFHGGAPLESGLVAVTVGMFIWMIYSVDNFEFLLATALVASLLISVHSWIADDLILYPAYVLMRSAASHPLLHRFWIFILTPVPFYLFLVNATPYSVVLPVLLVALFVAQAALVPKRALADCQPSIALNLVR